jgi:hypothetical protein
LAFVLVHFGDDVETVIHRILEGLLPEEPYAAMGIIVYIKSRKTIAPFIVAA